MYMQHVTKIHQRIQDLIPKFSLSFFFFSLTCSLILSEKFSIIINDPITNFLQEFFMEVIDINNVNDFLPIKN